MPRDPAVDDWFAARTDHPLIDAMQEVRRAILAADRRVTESIKWKCPTFSYEGNIASIDPKAKQHVSVLFHQGATIPGRHPGLEGGGTTARYMRFADRADVKRRRDAVQSVIRAWVAMKDGG
ncbi:MAG TPA: DUF1801 domain-containing protein [Actinomycetota bacterium]|jgi:hypothetical protein